MSPPNASSGQPRNFNGRVVLITGAGSGVGLECARVFATQGAKLLLVGRSADKLQAAAAELAETRAQTAICAGDVADSAFATKAMEAAQEAFAARVVALGPDCGGWECGIIGAHRKCCLARPPLTQLLMLNFLHTTD